MLWALSRFIDQLALLSYSEPANFEGPVAANVCYDLGPRRLVEAHINAESFINLPQYGFLVIGKCHSKYLSYGLRRGRWCL